jgi:hypothetical protein
VALTNPRSQGGACCVEFNVSDCGTAQISAALTSQWLRAIGTSELGQPL